MRRLPLSNPIRILFIIARGDSFGGSSKHVTDMAARLKADGHAAKVLIGGVPDMEVPLRLAAKGVDFTCIPTMGREIDFRKDWQALRDLRRHIREFAPDLVSTHASKGGALGRLACVGLGIPVIYTPHCWSFVKGFPGATLYRRLERHLARFATTIVAVSEDERRIGLENGVGRPHQTVVIHNGIEERPVAPSGQRGGSKREEVFITMVGRFERQKDQKLLLTTLARIRNLSWRLTLVGEGPLKAECAALAKCLEIADRVRFAGYSDAVETHLDESDLFVLITHWEGFPRSILEAMAAGLPVIATDVGGCRESAIDGVTGRLVPECETEPLEAALRVLIADQNLRQAMGRLGQRRFLERFTFDRMYRDYLRLYETLLPAAPAHKVQPARRWSVPGLTDPCR